MTDHTPAPWRVARDSMHVYAEDPEDHTQTRQVATVTTPDPQQGFADARLIALAPEMLGLLCILDRSTGSLTQRHRTQIAAMVARATEGGGGTVAEEKLRLAQQQLDHARAELLLVRSAPELLKALRRLLYEVTDGVVAANTPIDTKTQLRCVKLATEAIAAATGDYHYPTT